MEDDLKKKTKMKEDLNFCLKNWNADLQNKWKTTSKTKKMEDDHNKNLKKMKTTSKKNKKWKTTSKKKWKMAKKNWQKIE